MCFLFPLYLFVCIVLRCYKAKKGSNRDNVAYFCFCCFLFMIRFKICLLCLFIFVLCLKQEIHITLNHTSYLNRGKVNVFQFGMFGLFSERLENIFNLYNVNLSFNALFYWLYICLLFVFMYEFCC